MKAWWGVDLDGTLAVYGKWAGANDIGEPVPKMVERVKKWLAEGRDVRIVTARVFPIGIAQKYTGMEDNEYNVRLLEAFQAKECIKDWCFIHLGKVLPIQCWKDYGMIELWDDRCVQVIKNTGERVDGPD